METDQRMSRISATTDFYLSRFGRTQIGIFQLSTSERNPPWFYIFINSLMAALRRKNFMPYNFWFRDMTGNRIILILWVSGYFRNDLHSVGPGAGKRKRAGKKERIRNRRPIGTGSGPPAFFRDGVLPSSGQSCQNSQYLSCRPFRCLRSSVPHGGVSCLLQ